MSYGQVSIKTNSKFCKIDAGSPKDIRLIDASPVELMKHTLPNGQILCNGASCLKCADGDSPKQKFVTNVYNHTDKKVQIFEYGTSIAKQFKSIAITLEEEAKSILDVDLKIEAEGSNMTKKYKVTPRMTAKPLPDGIVRLKIDGEISF